MLNELIIYIKIIKVSFKKFLQFRKILGFDLLKCPYIRKIQFAEHFLIDCCLHIKKKNRIQEKNKRKAPFDKINNKEILTCLEFIKKAAQFIKL